MEFKSFTPDPRRIHGDPRPSTPFSHFRGNVRQKKSEKKDRIISLSPHRDDDLSFICADEKFEIRFDEPYSLLFDRSRKEKREKSIAPEKFTRGTKFARLENSRSTGFHLSVVSRVFLFSCSSFRNTGRPIFTFRLNFVFSNSKFGASPGLRWFLNRTRKDACYLRIPSSRSLSFATKFRLPRRWGYTWANLEMERAHSDSSNFWQRIWVVIFLKKRGKRKKV